jgi:hypothetical protein
MNEPTATDASPDAHAPAPQRYATYNGNRTNMLQGLYGPNDFGEIMCAVDVVHDPDTDTSRVGFAYATLPQLKAALAAVGATEISATAFTAVATAMAYAKALA